MPRRARRPAYACHSSSRLAKPPSREVAGVQTVRPQSILARLQGSDHNGLILARFQSEKSRERLREADSRYALPIRTALDDSPGHGRRGAAAITDGASPVGDPGGVFVRSSARAAGARSESASRRLEPGDEGDHGQARLGRRTTPSDVSLVLILLAWMRLDIGLADESWLVPLTACGPAASLLIDQGERPARGALPRRDRLRSEFDERSSDPGAGEP
jgi:hypothetical protein